MVCLCFFCEKLPTLAGWPCLYGSTQTGARYTCSLRGAARHPAKTAQSQPNVWPIRLPLEALTGAANSVMDKRRTLALESIPKRGLCAQAVGLHCVWAAPLIWTWPTDTAEGMVSCSLVKNLPLHSGGCFRSGNRTFLGNWLHSSPIAEAVFIVPPVHDYMHSKLHKWVPYYTSMSARKMA